MRRAESRPRSKARARRWTASRLSWNESRTSAVSLREWLTRRALLRDLAFGLVGGRFNLRVKTFQHALEEGLLIQALAVHGFCVDDVAREVREHDSPGKRIFPGAGAQADVLTLLGNPDAQQFEGGLVFAPRPAEDRDTCSKPWVSSKALVDAMPECAWLEQRFNARSDFGLRRTPPRRECSS